LALALLGLPWAARAETTLEIYGTAHVSADYVDRDMASVHNNTALTCNANPGDCVNSAPYTQLSSNLSYLGFRVNHDIGDSGMKALFQIETQVDVTATPGIKDSLGSRDTYVGLGTGAGAFKIGKADSPYKRATASYDPFSATVGDYNAIMGNTGGDNRAEFDLRLPHAAWWESPKMGGVSIALMAAPGQNRVNEFDPNGTGDVGRNSGFPQGENNCSGAAPGGSGTMTLGGNPDTKPNPGFRCTDGSFGDAYSLSLGLDAGMVRAVAAYELHSGVNRHGDDAGNYQVGVHDEWAAKAGAQLVTDTTTLSAIYESMNRDRSDKNDKESKLVDERSRTGYYLSGVQKLGDGGNAMLAWAHADKTPGDPVAQKAIDNEANLYSVGYRQFLDKSFSLYRVYAVEANNKGAHYDLGASGHGIPIVGRDGSAGCAQADGCLPGDANGVVKATNISSFSLGVIYTFSAPFEVSVASK
jgi:hypothetical protein